MSPLRISGLCRQRQLLLLEQGLLLLPVGRQQVLFQQEKETDQEDCKGAAGQGLVSSDRLYTPKKPQLYDAVIRLDDSGGKYVSFKMEFDR